MPRTTGTYRVTALPSSLGWMAILGKGRAVQQLVFGHSTRARAIAALDEGMVRQARHAPRASPSVALVPRPESLCRSMKPTRCNGWALPTGTHFLENVLVRRLQAYAEGEPEDFRDVQVDLDGLSRFRRRVFEACRQIPYGETLSYAELAVRAGFPKAFRAVGNCLAANRVPLIIPCHRVVCSNGQIGRFSAPGGGGMKQRLIQLEAPNWPRIE